MVYTIKINGNEYQVEVEKGKANILSTKSVPVEEVVQQVAAPQVSVTQTVAAPVSVATPVVSTSGTAVKAPLPGTVLSVKVQQGASVNKGDLLLIIEAMKMENEIFAPVSGVVSQILVNSGANVSTGDILISIT